MTISTQTTAPDYEPIPAFGRRIGLSVTSIYEALGKGHLKAKKIGRKTVIDVKAGLTWIEAQPSWKRSTPVARRRDEPQ